MALQRRRKTPRRRFCDPDVRSILRAHLTDEFANDTSTVILDEFGCAGVRADVAVVNGKLHGFEIKSEADSLDRLENQIRGYSAVFDSVTAVVADKHVAKVRRAIPGWWGITSVLCNGDKLELKQVRGSKKNPKVDADHLARILWRDEVYAFLRTRELHSGLRTASAKQLRQHLIETTPVADIAAEVRRRLKERGALPVVQQRTRNGGSYTTGPTAAARQKNLDWLLSLQ